MITNHFRFQLGLLDITLIKLIVTFRRDNIQDVPNIRSRFRDSGVTLRPVLSAVAKTSTPVPNKGPHWVSRHNKNYHSNLNLDVID
jgi:hypothetical protein